ncbi:hypothetical protein [Desulfoluna butyratoxydans]|uniref:Uncharacterized protein n=1 Tax=Desulfoluna butyratoxydans TaxID=231438 RepID=A0A4U8YT29_9BACT|nr:hypothetical protein [Desulfoluna butyratoxydans]VFQ46974.1 hypothetical protein MSL71_46560 [Desulfoluna butyratoxydans]
MENKFERRLWGLVLALFFLGSACTARPWHHDAGEYVVVQPGPGESLEKVAADFGGGAAGLPAVEALNPPGLTPANTPLLVPTTPAYDLGIRSDGYQTVPVLTYRWLDGEHSESVEKRLQSDLLQLKSMGASLLTPEAFLGFIRMERSVSRGAVLLAFEVTHAEGFRDFLSEAEHTELPGLLFLDPSQVGEAGQLTWEEVVQLAQGGLEPALLPAEARGLSAPAPKESLVGYTRRVKEAVTSSHKRLVSHTGQPVRFAAYPDGTGNSVLASVMVSLGTKGIFVFGEGGNPFFCDNLSIVRMDAGARGAEEPLDRYLDTFRKARLAW